MNSSLSARFLRGLDRSPDGAAIRFGDQVVTYRQAHAKALRWAGALHAVPNKYGEPKPPAVVGVIFGQSVDSYQGLRQMAIPDWEP